MQFLRVSFLLWLLACATVQAQVVETPELVPAYAKVPVAVGGFFNSTIEMTAEVFKPEGREPFPVVYSHGSSCEHSLKYLASVTLDRHWQLGHEVACS